MPTVETQRLTFDTKETQMMQRDSLPTTGAAFWYVGAGDSTTLFVGTSSDETDIVVQVDLNHMVKAEDDDEAYVPLIDQLVELLPEVGDRPYLAVFALTHPDEDHCRGFARLLDDVTIGELWLTPRVFDEYKKDLSDDATAFREEADRRVNLASKGDVGSGDRVRVVGRAELFDTEPYSAIPEAFRSGAGSEITELDGEEFADRFRAFIHAPFAEDGNGERNDTSLAMQVTLVNDDCSQRFLLLGDLAHETIAKIVDRTTDDSDLEWDVLLAPHHCSKRALFDDDDTPDSDVIDGLTAGAADGAWVVSSSPPVPASNQAGDDPPHRIAWDKYGEIVGDDQILCTGDHGSADDPDPIVFDVGDECGYTKPDAERAMEESALAAAVAASQPKPARPRDRTGYGIL